MLSMNFSVKPTPLKKKIQPVKYKPLVRTSRMTALILEKPTKCGSCSGAK